jgi:hypothetical protein
MFFIFKRFDKAFVVVLSCVFIIVGCGGRAANPVMISQYGDQRKSCEALQMEMAQNHQEITRLLPETEKTGKNAALGVLGVFILVPWFFMDFSESEQIEVNAYRQRYNNLALIAMEKKCGYDITPIPSFVKPKEEKVEEDNPANEF